MAYRCQSPKYDFEKLKTSRIGVPMNFRGIKKLLQMVSHDLWAQNRKIVFHGIWNPRACRLLNTNMLTYL